MNILLAEPELLPEFYQYGKSMFLVAIFTVVGTFFPIMPLIALIFLFIALGSLNKINYKMDSPYLHEHRSNFIKGFITCIIGVPLLAVGISFLVLTLERSPIHFFGWIVVAISSAAILAGFILTIVGFSLQMKSWENLMKFFENNKEMFPELISENAIDGARNLRTGALMYALWFLIVPLLIGFIYQAIGYFQLAKFNQLNMYPQEEIAPKTINPPPEPVKQPLEFKIEKSHIESDIPRFCPNCGTKISKQGKFCSLCGSKLRVD